MPTCTSFKYTILLAQYNLALKTSTRLFFLGTQPQGVFSPRVQLRLHPGTDNTVSLIEMLLPLATLDHVCAVLICCEPGPVGLTSVTVFALPRQPFFFWRLHHLS